MIELPKHINLFDDWFVGLRLRNYLYRSVVQFLLFFNIATNWGFVDISKGSTINSSMKIIIVGNFSGFELNEFCEINRFEAFQFIFLLIILNQLLFIFLTFLLWGWAYIYLMGLACWFCFNGWNTFSCFFLLLYAVFFLLLHVVVFFLLLSAVIEWLFFELGKMANFQYCKVTFCLEMLRGIMDIRKSIIGDIFVYLASNCLVAHWFFDFFTSIN